MYGEEGRLSMVQPILAVDDSAPIREMIVSILTPRGHRVATAENGREALQRLRAAGLSLTAIGAKVGISKSAVHRMLLEPESGR